MTAAGPIEDDAASSGEAGKGMPEFALGGLPPDALLTLLEHVADGIVLVDAAGMVRLVNPAAEALFARPASALVGAPFGAPVQNGDPSEIDVVRPGGELVTAELRAAPLSWKDAPAWLVSLRDVTDRKRAELQSRALAEAEAASHAKSEFLAVMSHELRTPLNAILGYADLLELGITGPLTEEQRGQLGRIAASARHLLGLVNEVLDIARVEEGRLTVRRVTGRVSEAVDAAVTLVRPQADERGLTLDLPPDGDGLTYLGDEDRVRQILVNLLANAVKFTDPGGRIRVASGRATAADAVRPDGAQRPGAWVWVSVADTGIGIPLEQQESIFDPFVQARGGRSRPKDGTGLGLTISRRLARLMGGDITLRSAPGEGARFTLWLPAAGAESAAAPLVAAAPPTLVARRATADVAAALLASLDTIVAAFVARLRHDPPAPAAVRLPGAQLADHCVTLLADVSVVLAGLAESGGAPSPLLVDGTAIQRAVAERHGQQRVPLGWTPAAVKREFAILGEEAERGVRGVLRGRELEGLDDALLLMRRALAQAEAVSVRAAERARTREEAAARHGGAPHRERARS